MVDDRTGSMRDVWQFKVAVPIDSNQWTVFVWLLIDHQFTDTNRYQLTNFIDWYWSIDWFSDHRFPSIGFPWSCSNVLIYTVHVIHVIHVGLYLTRLLIDRLAWLPYFGWWILLPFLDQIGNKSTAPPSVKQLRLGNLVQVNQYLY